MIIYLTQNLSWLLQKAPFYIAPFSASNFIREKVTTTNFTTSKTKKNIKKFANHHYIESLHLSDQNIKSDKDQNIENTKITTSKVVDHYYENHNVKNNIESHNWLTNHFRRCDHSQSHR